MSERRYFFITGLPRSRTAWLANYLTWGECFCFHDALRECDHPEQLREVFGRVPHADFIGHADPANLFFQKALTREFPEAQWIVIDHAAEHAAAAAQEAFGRAIDPEIYLRKIAELDECVDVMHVPMEELNRWTRNLVFALTGDAFLVPEARHEQLCRMQVQILPALLRADIERGISPQLLSRVEL